ncbi:hypothetical protein BG20_I2335, partial [Candidatus Nitrosarchaeum limnium BG20]
YDAEFTPIVSQSIQTIIGIKVIDENTIDVYVNYWHFDKGEIAEWASLWSTVPWEISAAMEQAVLDGKASFSRSGATNKNISWISLIVPNDAQMIKRYLDEFSEKKFIPKSLESSKIGFDYFNNRYNASSKWITEHNHAVISNGPFYLSAYSPESRTITVNAFDDQTYPFKAGHWAEFESTIFPEIVNVNVPDIVEKESDLIIDVETTHADSILYFITGNNENSTLSEIIKIDKNFTEINISGEDVEKLGVGAKDLKIFAISNSVLKPDYYSTGFLVVKNKDTLPEINQVNVEFNRKDNFEAMWLIIIGICVIIGVSYIKKRKNH